MRYISLHFFLPQQNQLSSQARKRGVFGRLWAWPGLEKTRPTGGQSDGGRKRGGEERGGYTNMEDGQQRRWVSREEREEEGGLFKERREEVGYSLDMHKQEMNRQAGMRANSSSSSSR